MLRSKKKWLCVRSIFLCVVDLFGGCTGPMSGHNRDACCASIFGKRVLFEPECEIPLSRPSKEGSSTYTAISTHLSIGNSRARWKNSGTAAFRASQQEQKNHVATNRRTAWVKSLRPNGQRVHQQGHERTCGGAAQGSAENWKQWTTTLIPRSSGLGTHPSSAECAQVARRYKAARGDERTRAKQNRSRVAPTRQIGTHECPRTLRRATRTPGCCLLLFWRGSKRAFVSSTRYSNSSAGDWRPSRTVSIPARHADVLAKKGHHHEVI